MDEENKLPENFEDAIADLPIDEQEVFHMYMAFGHEVRDDFGYDEDIIDKGEMTFCKILVDYLDNMIASRRIEDYVVNKPQMEKFGKALKFFSNYLKRMKGWIEPLEIEPRQEWLDLVVHVYVLDLSNEDLKEFIDILSYASAIDMDAEKDGMVSIGFTFPNVFIHK